MYMTRWSIRTSDSALISGMHIVTPIFRLLSGQRNWHLMVRHVHIHDNAGERDSHLGLGRGNLPWREVLSYLPRTETRTWTIECMNKEDVQICVQSLLT